MPPLKIVLADDHPMFVEGVALILSSMPAINVVATANNGEEVLNILKNEPCDMAVLDFHMPVMNGLETTKRIKNLYPAMQVLILTMEDELAIIKNVLNAGASGYILKTAAKEEIQDAVSKVARGEIYLGSAISVGLEHLQSSFRQKLNNHVHAHSPLLTNREIEIVKLIAEEYTSTQIAEKLFISTQTVDTHRKNIMRKLGVSNALGMIKFALLKGLIELG